jgi:UDP-glucose 4-epimerase
VTKHIVVTGVAELIGSKVAARMASEAFSVVGVNDLSSGNKMFIPASIDFVEGDLANAATIAKLPNQCDTVLHLVAATVGKLAAENYLAVFAKQLPSVRMRMFNVYGPGQDMENLRHGLVNSYLAQALKNKHIVVKGSLEHFCEFIFIDNVDEA